MLSSGASHKNPKLSQVPYTGQEAVRKIFENFSQMSAALSRFSVQLDAIQTSAKDIAVEFSHLAFTMQMARSQFGKNKSSLLTGGGHAQSDAEYYANFAQREMAKIQIRSMIAKQTGTPDPNMSEAERLDKYEEFLKAKALRSKAYYARMEKARQTIGTLEYAEEQDRLRKEEKKLQESLERRTKFSQDYYKALNAQRTKDLADPSSQAYKDEQARQKENLDRYKDWLDKKKEFAKKWHNDQQALLEAALKNPASPEAKEKADRENKSLENYKEWLKKKKEAAKTFYQEMKDQKDKEDKTINLATGRFKKEDEDLEKIKPYLDFLKLKSSKAKAFYEEQRKLREEEKKKERKDAKAKEPALNPAYAARRDLLKSENETSTVTGTLLDENGEDKLRTYIDFLVAKEVEFRGHLDRMKQLKQASYNKEDAMHTGAGDLSADGRAKSQKEKDKEKKEAADELGMSVSYAKPLKEYINYLQRKEAALKTHLDKMESIRELKKSPEQKLKDIEKNAEAQKDLDAIAEGKVPEKKKSWFEKDLQERKSYYDERVRLLKEFLEKELEAIKLGKENKSNFYEFFKKNRSDKLDRGENPTPESANKKPENQKDPDAETLESLGKKDDAIKNLRTMAEEPEFRLVLDTETAGTPGLDPQKNKEDYLESAEIVQVAAILVDKVGNVLEELNVLISHSENVAIPDLAKFDDLRAAHTKADISGKLKTPEDAAESISKFLSKIVKKYDISPENLVTESKSPFDKNLAETGHADDAVRQALQKMFPSNSNKSMSGNFKDLDDFIRQVIKNEKTLFKVSKLQVSLLNAEKERLIEENNPDEAEKIQRQIENPENASKEYFPIETLVKHFVGEKSNAQHTAIADVRDENKVHVAIMDYVKDLLKNVNLTEKTKPDLKAKAGQSVDMPEGAFGTFLQGVSTILSQLIKDGVPDFKNSSEVLSGVIEQFTKNLGPVSKVFEQVKADPDSPSGNTLPITTRAGAAQRSIAQALIDDIAKELGVSLPKLFSKIVVQSKDFVDEEGNTYQGAVRKGGTEENPTQTLEIVIPKDASLDERGQVKAVLIEEILHAILGKIGGLTELQPGSSTFLENLAKVSFKETDKDQVTQSFDTGYFSDVEEQLMLLIKIFSGKDLTSLFSLPKNTNPNVKFALSPINVTKDLQKFLGRMFKTLKIPVLSATMLLTLLTGMAGGNEFQKEIEAARKAKQENINKDKARKAKMDERERQGLPRDHSSLYEVGSDKYTILKAREDKAAEQEALRQKEKNAPPTKDAIEFKKNDDQIKKQQQAESEQMAAEIRQRTKEKEEADRKEAERVQAIMDKDAAERKEQGLPPRVEPQTQPIPKLSTVPKSVIDQLRSMPLTENDAAAPPAQPGVEAPKPVKVEAEIPAMPTPEQLNVAPPPPMGPPVVENKGAPLKDAPPGLPAINPFTEYKDAEVKAVYDGDTLTIRYTDAAGNVQESQIRLYGIDTPEKANKEGKWLEQPGAEAAKQMLEKLTKGKKLRVVFRNESSYQRDIAEIYDQDTNESINQKMLEEGMAQLSFVRTPNFEKIKAFGEAQQKAIGGKKGNWRFKNNIDPQVWRNKLNKFQQQQNIQESQEEPETVVPPPEPVSPPTPSPSPTPTPPVPTPPIETVEPLEGPGASPEIITDAGNVPQESPPSRTGNILQASGILIGLLGLWKTASLKGVKTFEDLFEFMNEAISRRKEEEENDQKTKEETASFEDILNAWSDKEEEKDKDAKAAPAGTPLSPTGERDPEVAKLLEKGSVKEIDPNSEKLRNANEAQLIALIKKLLILQRSTDPAIVAIAKNNYKVVMAQLDELRKIALEKNPSKTPATSPVNENKTKTEKKPTLKRRIRDQIDKVEESLQGVIRDFKNHDPEKFRENAPITLGGALAETWNRVSGKAYKQNTEDEKPADTGSSPPDESKPKHKAGGGNVGNETKGKKSSYKRFLRRMFPKRGSDTVPAIEQESGQAYVLTAGEKIVNKNAAQKNARGIDNLNRGLPFYAASGSPATTSRPSSLGSSSGDPFAALRYYIADFIAASRLAFIAKSIGELGKKVQEVMYTFGNLVKVASPDTFSTLQGSLQLLSGTIGLQLIPAFLKASQIIQGMAREVAQGSGFMGGSVRTFSNIINYMGDGFMKFLVGLGLASAGITLLSPAFSFVSTLITRVLAPAIIALWPYIFSLGSALISAVSAMGLFNPAVLAVIAGLAIVTTGLAVLSSALKEWEDRSKEDVNSRETAKEKKYAEDVANRGGNTLEGREKELAKEKKIQLQKIFELEKQAEGLDKAGKTDQARELRRGVLQEERRKLNALENQSLVERDPKQAEKRNKAVEDREKLANQLSKLADGERQNKLEATKQGLAASFSSMKANSSFSSVEEAYKKVQVSALGDDPMTIELKKLNEQGIARMLQELQKLNGTSKDIVTNLPKPPIGV
jgi:micrococcal nuclease